MMGRTHAMVAAGAVVPVALISGQPLVIGVGLIAGLLPDLDASDGMLKHWHFTVGKGKERIRIKPFYPLAVIVAMIFPHRGFLHSLYACLLFSFILLVFTPWYAAAAGFIGYLSHILLDSMTPSGVPLLMMGKWHILPEKFRIHTNSYLEHLFLAIAGVFVVAYLLPLVTRVMPLP